VYVCMYVHVYQSNHHPEEEDGAQAQAQNFRDRCSQAHRFWR
jgi:hypothetical protein